MSLLLALQARLAGDYAGAFNVVPDPSFEAADLSQWTVVGGATLSQSTSNATSRTHSLRVQGTLASQGARIAVPTIPGQLYTASVDVFVATGAGTVTATLLVQGTGLGAPPGGTGAFTLGGAFRATAASTLITLLNDGGAGAFDFYFDSLALIPAPAVPYFDGSSAGGEWLGTPDHSTSRLDDVATRVARNLGRTGGDALGTHDDVARIGFHGRTGPDSLGTTDAAARPAAHLAGTARDYLRPDYRTLVLAEATLASYVRLGEAAGSPTVADSVGPVTGTVGTGITLGAAGLVGGDADTAARGAAGTIDFGDSYDFAGNAPFTVELIVSPDAFGQRVVGKADGSGGWSVDIDAGGHVVAARRG